MWLTTYFWKVRASKKIFEGEEIRVSFIIEKLVIVDINVELHFFLNLFYFSQIYEYE